MLKKKKKKPYMRSREWSKVKRQLSPRSVLARSMLVQPLRLCLHTKFTQAVTSSLPQTKEWMQEGPRGQLPL